MAYAIQVQGAPSRASRRYWSTLGLGLLLTLGLVGCAPFGSTSSPSKSVDQQPGLTPGTPGVGVAPAGWRRVLNGQTFSDSTAANGMAVSHARLAQLAACALPVNPSGGRPVFLLSNDGGRTWQSHAILGGASHWQTCFMLADAQLANTFALEIGSEAGPNGGISQVELTTNAGRTWRVVAPPPGFQVGIYATGETTLDDGTLLAVLASQSPTHNEFARLTPDGVWHNLSNSLPDLHNAVTGADQVPGSVTVDPSNPNRILIAQTAPQGTAIFLSDDAGATWRPVYSLPSSLVVRLWSGPAQRFYAQDVIHNVATATQFFYSADGGETWVGSGLHANGAYASDDSVFVSPSGRVLTAWNGQFFTLNPATGVFALLGAVPAFASGILSCVIVEGPSPSLVCTGGADTFARSLPSLA